MTQLWNGKALIDHIVKRTWRPDTAANRELARNWLSEIQDDLVGELPQDEMLFKLKKLIPSNQEVMLLAPPRPADVGVVLTSGGSLTDGSSYKVYQTFVIYDDDKEKYIESEPSSASLEKTADSTNKTITAYLAVMGGDTSVSPTNVYRRIYVATKASGGTYSEPLFLAEVEDNTTTTYSITSEPTSAITPPSDGEVDHVSSDLPYLDTNSRYLVKVDRNSIRRYDPNDSTSDAPDAFDYIGTDRIRIYPKLDPQPGDETVTYATGKALTLEDSDKLEQTADGLTLKKLSYTDENSWISCNTSINADRSDDTSADLTGTATGGAAISSGKLDVSGGTKYVTYDGRLADGEQTFAWEAYVTPQYTGSPGSIRTFFSVSEDAANDQSQIMLTHETSGQIKITIKDLNGGSSFLSNIAAWSPTSGTEYHIAVSVNLATASPSSTAIRVFIDGVQIGSTLTGANVNQDVKNHYSVGANWNGSNPGDFLMRWIRVWTVDKYTANFTPNTVEPFNYSTSEVYAIEDTGREVARLNTFSETKDNGSNGTIKYIMEVEGQDFYPSGTAWLPSTANSENGTAAEVNTAAAMLMAALCCTVKIKIVMASSDGYSSPPVLKTNALNYDTNLKTLSYYVHRRPHEIHYDIDRPIDLPISAKKALIEGAVWKGYAHADRSGQQSKLNNYMQFKQEFKNKVTRHKGRLGLIRDVEGDAYGYEV